MSKSASVSRAEQAVLIVFADITRFMVNARSTPDATLAELLDGYYRHADGLVAAAGGRVVKFMGDAFLALWPEARAGHGVEALPGLKRAIDAWWAARGWDSRVIVKAHFGRAVIGPFGTEARFDVIGNGRDASGADGVAVGGGVPVPRGRKAQGVQEAHGAGGVHSGGRSAALTALGAGRRPSRHGSGNPGGGQSGQARSPCRADAPLGRGCPGPVIGAGCNSARSQRFGLAPLLQPLRGEQCTLAAR